MSQAFFENPVLPGFYPDPSICKAPDGYYLVTSSFVYYPGLPLFHSTDLVHWEQIGHAIHRPEQLDYQNCETSLGLWAPTIRYHKGTFYIINTFVSKGREASRDNYILTATDPKGPWSDPIWIKGADGIDPSLFFDEDGSLWYTGNYICSNPLYEGHHGIYLVELDPVSFQFKGERSIIWDGYKTRSKWIEAPHLYKKDGYYYLLVAEGGTFTNHSIMMARCTTLNGDYEICPRNPIVTHRHIALNSDISVVGHGDLIETEKGEWWMFLLGVRPYTGFHFNLGRETFLAPIRWAEDGWPILDNAVGLVQSKERFPNLEENRLPLASPNDPFDQPTLSFNWNTIHAPLAPFYSLVERPGFLRLYTRPEVLHEICTPSFIGRRQQHKVFLAETVMEFSPKSESESAGIAILQDDRYHYTLTQTLRQNTSVLQLHQTKNGLRTLLHEIPLKKTSKLYLFVQGNVTTYSFYYGYSEQERLPIATNLDGSLLSSNVNEGFTGTYIGLYTSSHHAPTTSFADFDWFNYIH